MLMLGLRLILPTEGRGFPATAWTDGRVETWRVQAAPVGSIEIVARLLMKFPIWTATGMKHPATPPGIVNRFRSRGAVIVHG
jgi:hypothetical protein